MVSTKRKSDPKRRRTKRAGAPRTNTRKKTKRAKKPKVYNQDRYIFPALRRVWRYYPLRRKTLEEAFNPETGLYLCALCKREVEDVQVDHIQAIGTCKRPDGRTDYNMFVDRLLTTKDNLQCLCVPCHKQKTKIENKERSDAKKALNSSD